MHYYGNNSGKLNHALCCHTNVIGVREVLSYHTDCDNTLGWSKIMLFAFQWQVAVQFKGLQ